MGTKGDVPAPGGGTTRLLLEAAAGGDTKAQGGLLTRFDPALRAVVHKYLGRERFLAEGEDLLQEVRRAIVRALPAFRGRDRASFVAWVRRVSTTKAIDWVSRRPPSPKPLPLHDTKFPLVPASGDSPSRLLLREEDMERVRRAIETVPERYRMVLQLMVNESVERDELPARLGRGAEATRKHVERALEALRRALRKPPA